jgi:hypothetical protein
LGIKGIEVLKETNELRELAGIARNGGDGIDLFGGAQGENSRLMVT